MQVKDYYQLPLNAGRCNRNKKSCHYNQAEHLCGDLKQNQRYRVLTICSCL